MNEQTLNVLYENFADKPGWMTNMINTLNLATSDVAYLEWLDDKRMECNQKVKMLERQVEGEGGEEIYFLETDQEKLDVVNMKIALTESSWEEAYKADRPTFEKGLILWTNGYDRLKKLRRKIRARMIYTKYPETMALTEHEIAIAREFPLKDLVEVNRAGFMLCPFHSEKTPSFKVKDWGYCFGCGKSCDAIAYQMQFLNMKFVEAVKSLQS